MSATTWTRKEIVDGAVSYARKAIALLQRDDETFITARADRSGEQVVILHDHYEIHAGNHFTCSDISPELDTATYYWTIVTPASARLAHFDFDISCNVASRVYWYEGSTVTVPGTAVEILNNRRDSAVTNGLTITKNSTVTVDGLLLWSAVFGGASTPVVRASGSGGPANERILAASKTYTIKITTLVNDGIAHLNMYWYEEEP